MLAKHETHNTLCQQKFPTYSSLSSREDFFTPPVKKDDVMPVRISAFYGHWLDPQLSILRQYTSTHLLRSAQVTCSVFSRSTVPECASCHHSFSTVRVVLRVFTEAPLQSLWSTHKLTDHMWVNGFSSVLPVKTFGRSYTV